MSQIVSMMEDGETQTIPAEEINITNVKNIIYKNDNPHPLIISALAMVLIIFIYYIYVVFIKTCFGGRWLTDGEYGGAVVIRHNKWNNTVHVDDVGSGIINGAAIYLRTSGSLLYSGVLHNNNIYWIGGAVWKRPIYL